MRILAILSVLLLAACCPELKAITEQATIENLNPPTVDPIHPKKVIWKVLNKDTVKDVDLTKSVFILTERDYKAIATNNGELVRYIKQQKAIIAYYKKTLENRNPKKEEK